MKKQGVGEGRQLWQVEAQINDNDWHSHCLMVLGQDVVSGPFIDFPLR